MPTSTSSTTLPTMDINNDLFVLPPSSPIPDGDDDDANNGSGGDINDNNGDDVGAPTPPLDDVSNYIEGELFFKLLQDEGVEPYEDEKFEYDRDKSKTKAKHIRFGNPLYPQVWTATRDLYKILKKKKTLFQKYQRIQLSPYDISVRPSFRRDLPKENQIFTPSPM